MITTLRARPITKEAISGLCELIEAAGVPDKLINNGRCGRFHNLARLDIEGEVGISLFQSETFAMPFKMEMMERHPLGSQAFLPMQEHDYLVVLAEDKDGRPDNPRAFIASAGQAVNIGRNVWHGVLCPLSGAGLFTVVDRVTGGPNLEEHWFETPILIEM